MPERGQKKRGGSSASKRKAKPPRPGIPSKASIVAIDTLISPKGRRYTIVETNQLDPYDDPKEAPKKRRPE